MPGPPPPPPPGVLPPPPMPSTAPKGGGSDDRSALLKQIQKGARLKKTITNDKSAPMIGARATISNNNSNTASSSSIGNPSTNSGTLPNGLNLGGLFAGGMPKLRATGKLGASTLNSSTNNNNNNDTINNKKPEIPSPTVKNISSVQSELRKQMASDNRNRGPPPPAPVRIPSENGTRQTPEIKTLNGVRSNPSSLHSSLQNNSTQRQKGRSNTNLTSLDHTDSVNGGNQIKPVISHGKPNLAPKPPLNGKPMAPPKKLIVNGKPVSRAHSMKSPRSPSPQSPDANVTLKFGTVRNLSSVIVQSLANSTGNLSPRLRPALNGRPNAPPPQVPSQQAPPPPPHGIFSTPPPPSKTSVKPPNHAPPPPPISIPQAPNHTPPPPPHRTQPTRAPPAVPSNLNAPPPPPRHSSMTSNRKIIIDLEEKFKHKFNDPSTFPRPPPYRHVYKFYGNKQVGNKQQAPQPPNLQSTSRPWDVSPAC